MSAGIGENHGNTPLHRVVPLGQEGTIRSCGGGSSNAGNRAGTTLYWGDWHRCSFAGIICCLLEPGINPEILDDPERKEAYHAQKCENVSPHHALQEAPRNRGGERHVLSHLRLTPGNYYRRRGFL